MLNSCAFSLWPRMYLLLGGVVGRPQVPVRMWPRNVFRFKLPQASSDCVTVISGMHWFAITAIRCASYKIRWLASMIECEEAGQHERTNKISFISKISNDAFLIHFLFVCSSNDEGKPIVQKKRLSLVKILNVFTQFLFNKKQHSSLFPINLCLCFDPYFGIGNWFPPLVCSFKIDHLKWKKCSFELSFWVDLDSLARKLAFPFVSALSQMIRWQLINLDSVDIVFAQAS